MSNQSIKIRKPLDFDNWDIKGYATGYVHKLEIVVEEFDSDVRLFDIVHSDISQITAKPVKRIKIGNGGQPYNELKSIIILDNADFIIIDKNGYIIDYITNHNPLEVTAMI